MEGFNTVYALLPAMEQMSVKGKDNSESTEEKGEPVIYTFFGDRRK